MSGGSWEYGYMRLDEMASRLMECRDPKRRAFGKLLEKCARAMHDIEWVDSGDWGPGDEAKSIDVALGSSGPCAVLTSVLEDAHTVLEELKAAIFSAEQVRR